MSQLNPLQEEGDVLPDLESGELHVPGRSRSQRNPPHLNCPPPSLTLKKIIAIGPWVWAIFTFFWNLYHDSKLVNDFYHQNPMTSHAILIISVVISYVIYFWLLVKLGEVPHLEDRYFALAVALLTLLVITLILNAVLPNKYSWIVWIFFAAIIWFTFDRQGWTYKIRRSVVESYKRATQWTDKISLF